MPPYHFIKNPTLQEFSDVANNYGVEIKELPSELHASDGNKHRLTYFERNIDGKPITYALPTLDFNDELSYNTLRSLCAILKIPIEKFAFKI